MTRDEIGRTVASAIHTFMKNKYDRTPRGICDASSLYSELYLNPYDVVTIVMDVGDALGIAMDEDMEYSTVGDIVDAAMEGMRDG